MTKQQHRRGWTEARKQRQREAIRRWTPWEEATGPKTEEGKQVSAANSWKHGGYTLHMRWLRSVLRWQKRRLSQIRKHLRRLEQIEDKF